MSDRLSRLGIPFAILLIIVATGGGAIPLHAQSGPVVSFEPANFTVAAGEEQTLEVKIGGSHDLGGFQFDLLFPPGSISLSRAAVGPLLSSTGRSALPLGPANESGRISFGGFTFGETAGAGGDGVLAVLVLRGETPGHGELRLDRVQVLDIQGNDLKPTIASAGTVEVTGSGPAATVTPGPHPDHRYR
ncbi:MAG: cohesin domain-containing protein [Ardenticatenaceae bacterium]|nr:cohesin domain-containing protein [Ardenticatenaceae bacterium]